MKPLRFFIVAGEPSGDALGAKLIAALKGKVGSAAAFAGVGGEEMAREGLVSIFPLVDVTVMGPMSILPRLPRIIRRVHQTVAAALRFMPDAVIIIDSPEFTHPIAKRIRAAAPEIPIIDYVSPSVWAWRPGRAKRMRPYIDEVLALLPFEPQAHVTLGGPHCTYVGHPLIERLDEIRNADAAGLARRLGLDPAKPVLLVLPGSRGSEVDRLIGVFGGTLPSNHLIPNLISLDLKKLINLLFSAIETEFSPNPNTFPRVRSGQPDAFVTGIPVKQS